MAAGFSLDDGTYESMIDYLNQITAAEKPGTTKDIGFMYDDFWLQDTAVIENVEQRHGEWNISLVFAHHLIPLKFIKRKIVNFACFKKAVITAHYMRRQAAKDQRGTLVVNSKLIKLSFN